MEFNTLDEALAAQTLCGTCGRPKKEVVVIYSDVTRYQLRRCKKFRCTVHCSKSDGCSHKLP